MTNVVISKTVKLVGSWIEDVVTDDVLKDIATRAKTQKGKKIKVKATEVGVKLTRARLFQEIQSTFYPISSVQTVMQSTDFPRCVMFVLTDPNKKYKILAVCCESDADAAQLTSALADIQSKVHSPNIELKKRENGNWTLRGRTFHNSNMHMLEIFSEHKQPNGDVTVAKTNGDTEVAPVHAHTEVHINGRNHHDTEHNKDKSKEKTAKMDDDSDEDDDYVIETEVTTKPYIAAEVATKPYIETEVTTKPYIATEVTTKPYIAAEIHAVRHGHDVNEVTRRFEHVSTKDNTDSSEHLIYKRPPKHQETTILPSHPIVYRATSSSTIASQPIVYNRSSRGYESMNATLYYTDPWAQRRVSRESSLVPMRMDGYRSNVKFDQQSIISNTSRVSRSRRLRASELSIPTTVRRSIDKVYPRPVVILRRGQHIAGYKPRPASYHAMGTNELQIYQEEDGEAAILL